MTEAGAERLKWLAQIHCKENWCKVKQKRPATLQCQAPISRGVFLFLFFYITDHAQAPGGNKDMMKAMKDIKGRVYGKLVDAKTKKPVEYASVVVLWYNKDSLLGGTLTQENGEFNIEGLPAMGGFRFRASQVGYKNYETKIYIQMPNKLEQDLGDIKMEIDQKMLNEVEVVAGKTH